jgi:outer membrane murein-binding lipoprotein Lpp
MKLWLALALALILSGCQNGITQGVSGEDALQNRAKAIEAAANEDVNATINQIKEDADAERPSDVAN